MNNNQLDFSARQVVDRLLPFVRKITAAPLPAVPGIAAGFYLELEAIRCEVATKICADRIERSRSWFGDAAAESVCRAWDPIQTEPLLKHFLLRGVGYAAE